MMHMTKATSVWVLAVSITALSACGTVRDRSRDYLQVDEMEPLVVPEHLSSETLGEIYPIPPIADTAVPLDSDGQVPRPQSVAANLFQEEVRIQNLGSERWILINRPTAEIWPRIRNLLQQYGIPVVAADAPRGVMDTGWLTFRDDEENSHRFRLNIAPGVQASSSEIKVLQNQVQQGGEEDQTGWPETSDSREREHEMLRIIAEALASDDAASAISLLAQDIGGKSRVSIQTPRVADPFLSMELDFLRAWASLVYSLERGGFSIHRQNQEEDSGVFHVSFVPPNEESPGFFRRVFSRGDDTQATGYQILVAPSGDGMAVRITDPEGSSLPREQAIRLLRIIQSNLT